MKEQIIFKTLVGSKLYGTDSENSDTDIKGVFIPDIQDLILCKAPKHYVFTTSDSKNKNDSKDIDETYYSLQYYFELLGKGDTTALDMLFAYTNYEKVIIDTPEWSEVVNNIDKLLTKNMKSYLCYCKNQCIKYSLKGKKLNNYKKFQDFCFRHFFDMDKNGKSITLYKALKNIIGDDFHYHIPIIGTAKTKFEWIDFGENCYIKTASNGESYLCISDAKFALSDTIRNTFDNLETIISSYGERAKKVALNNGVDYKAISHAVRVILQVEEILKTGHLTFPLKEASFIKSIKYHTTDMTFEEIMKWIEDKIKEIEEVLLPNSTLPEKADQNWINEFILKNYK